MVLPIDAPTPRMFAERYDLTANKPPLTKSQFENRDLEADCRDRIIELGEGGTFLKVHAKSQDPAIVWWGFEYLMKKFADQFRGPPHLIVARGAQWSRDSKRDFKVVGGKLAEREEHDPDPKVFSYVEVVAMSQPQVRRSRLEQESCADQTTIPTLKKKSRRLHQCVIHLQSNIYVLLAARLIPTFVLAQSDDHCGANRRDLRNPTEKSESGQDRIAIARSESRGTSTVSGLLSQCTCCSPTAAIALTTRLC